MKGVMGGSVVVTRRAVVDKSESRRIDNVLQPFENGANANVAGVASGEANGKAGVADTSGISRTDNVLCHSKIG